MIRVVLPHHLRTLARVGSEVELELNGQITQRAILDAVEDRYPMLRGTIRDHTPQKRRPMVPLFLRRGRVARSRISLPIRWREGGEALRIAGAIARSLRKARM
jgi:hypothetical protein